MHEKLSISYQRVYHPIQLLSLACLFFFGQDCSCCSITKLCTILCDPMDCSTLGFPVLHHLLEFAQTHTH